MGEKFIYSMKDISADLDKRIGQLEKFRDRLQAKVDGKVAVDKNAESLKRVTDSLTHAKDARTRVGEQLLRPELRVRAGVAIRTVVLS